MKKLSIEEVLSAVNGTCLQEYADAYVSGVSIDTRKIKPGDLFIALKGVHSNGHLFVKKAFEMGCNAVIVSEKVECELGKQVILVEDTLKALQALAKYYITLFQVKKIAVTGSTGKTTTKEILHTILSSKYQTAKNLGNLNNHIGLPLTALSIEEHHEVAIFEMGMSGLGEIDLMADIVKPDVALITNVGLSHIEKLGSRDNILKAKTEIVNYFNKNCTLVINNDDDMLFCYGKLCHGFSLITVGKSEDCDYRISELVENKNDGIFYHIENEKQIYPVHLKMIGHHNAYNASLAIAAAEVMGIVITDGVRAAGGFISTDKRLSMKELPNGTKIIDDTYNASPDSMKAAIDVLCSMSGMRRVAILGDMFEMGEYARACHYEVGEYAAKKGIDLVISVGEMGRAIYEGSIYRLDEVKRNRYYHDKKELLQELDQLLLPGDIILVKASRGMAMEEIVEAIQSA